MEALAESVRNRVGLHMVKSQTLEVSLFGWLASVVFRDSIVLTGDLELRDSPSLWLQSTRTKGCSPMMFCFCVGF